MGIKDKKITHYGGSLKNLIFSVKSKKNNIYGGLSKNAGLGQLADLRGRLTKKLGCF